MSKTFLFKAIQFSQTVMIQTIPFSMYRFCLHAVSMSKHLYFKQFSLTEVRSLNIKTVLFQVIQFNISTHFSSISPIDRNLTDATTPGQSELGSDGNEGITRIPQSSSISGTSPSDCFVSYPEHSLRCSRCILQPQLTGQGYPSNYLTGSLLLNFGDLP